jgi:hypothetical protein
MKQIIILLILTVFSINLYSQKENSDEILNEGKILFRLEKASWNATDHLMLNFKDKADSIGGYISYISEKKFVNTIFWSRYDSSQILIRYVFDSLPQTEPNSYYLNQISDKQETDLISIRNDALRKVYYENDDNFFTFYQNTSMNFIPLITDNERKVFVLTGPQTSGYVLLGNDYLLTYNENNKFQEKTKIHNSLIQLKYKEEADGKVIMYTIHTHVLTEIITSTDICTLLLYRDYVEWKQHYVFGKKYVSIFDVEKENLAIMTLKAFKKIYK